MPVIVADIGGTNARFAVATQTIQGLGVSRLWVRPSKGFVSLEESLAAYIEVLGTEAPSSACLSVAGPIMGDNVTLTNLDWKTSAQKMQAEFSMSRLTLINDCTALAYSLSELDSADFSTIKRGLSVAPGTKCILCSGTGFGVSGIFPEANGWQLIDGEGGHISFAPVTLFEVELLKVLMKRFQRVSIETLLSGPGLVNLYQAIAKVRGERALELLPADITNRGISGEDSLCETVLQTFCAILGGVAGDIALLMRPLGGVYLGGGILSKLEDILRSGDFCARFISKDPVAHFVSEMPVHLVNTNNAALIGAATYHYGGE